ncbi:MAG: hypothetical protein GXN91_00030, partial [Epsilonproteobacteria bacterium]|nr:hypothetical protein [Campylobacterota bacterium]
AQFALYLAVAIYGYFNRRWYWLGVGMGLLVLSIFNANYPIEGVPRGHLQTLLGIYAVTFSPFYFLAIVYALYRGAKGKKDIIWYIAIVALFVSILLSIRQKVVVIDFTPFLIISTPLVIEIFRGSVAIRLPQFRKRYYLLCQIVLIVLLLETLLIAVDYPIYKNFGKDLKIIDKSIYISSLELKK